MPIMMDNRKSISAQEVKEKLIQILMAHSRTFAMNNNNNNISVGGNGAVGCGAGSNGTNGVIGSSNCHPVLDQVRIFNHSIILFMSLLSKSASDVFITLQ